MLLVVVANCYSLIYSEPTVMDPRDGYNRGLLQGGFNSRSEIDCCPLASSGISKTPISDKGIELESGAVSDWSESRGRQQRFCGVGEGVC